MVYEAVIMIWQPDYKAMVWRAEKLLGPLYLELVVALGKQAKKRVKIIICFLGTFLLPVSVSIQAASYHFVCLPTHLCIPLPVHTIPRPIHPPTHPSIPCIHLSVYSSFYAPWILAYSSVAPK